PSITGRSADRLHHTSPERPARFPPSRAGFFVSGAVAASPAFGHIDATPRRETTFIRTFRRLFGPP
ncbi:hypothetical protein, partial [Caulobacter sp. HMWF025]|uniref:hypothetical protein n=1 Tax=Caulobacter sp. HMWF025 TaxID=2056860 RepID=UPI001E528745